MKNRLLIAIFVIFGFCAPLISQDYTKFSNVLLIVNFNHPYYGNIDFIKKLYGPFFKKIVFYGEVPHPEVVCVTTQKGFFVAEVLTDALTKNPDSDGYLFLEDDCILNIWNCFSLDINKIWILPGFTNNPSRVEYNHQFHWANAITGENANKWWFNGELGFPEVCKAFGQMLPEDVQIAENNFGKGTMIGTAADMFYIPAKYREKALRIAPHFSRVFVEIGMPCILACLDNKENWEKKISVLWCGYSFRTPWPSKHTCIHPCKLSNIALRSYLLKVFEFYCPEVKF